MVMRNRPRTSRQSVPTPAAIGLPDGQRALADLKELGWYDEDGLELLWGLAGAADPELALKSLVRLKERLDSGIESGEVPQWAAWSALDAAMRQQVLMRTRVFALLGGSSMLGDHMVANPTTWSLLLADLPTRADMFRDMLTAVEAVPEAPVRTDDVSVAEAAELEYREPTPSSPDLEEAGLYRAGVTGRDADVAMKR